MTQEEGSADEYGYMAGPADQATTDQLVAYLGRVPALYKRGHELAFTELDPASLAVSDMRLAFGESPARLAAARISHAAGHLSTWHLLLVKGQVVPERSHYVLARSAMEGCAEARYLTDPGVTSEARRKAAALMELDDFGERKKFEDKPPFDILRPTAPGMNGRDRYEHHRAKVRRQGWLTKDRNGKEVDPRPRPMVELFDEYSIGSWIYRLLSAFAHGFEWSTMWSKRTEAQPAPGRSNTYIGQITAHDDLTIVVAAQATIDLRDAIQAYERYIGPRAGAS